MLCSVCLSVLFVLLTYENCNVEIHFCYAGRHIFGISRSRSYVKASGQGQHQNSKKRVCLQVSAFD